MLLSLIAIMVFFQFMTGGTLLQPLNLTNLVLQNSYIVIMALGMLLVIVAGHIDLSVGSVAGFIGALAAVLMVTVQLVDSHRWPFDRLPRRRRRRSARRRAIGSPIFKIPSFIVTLAGMLVFKGLALALLQGQSVGPFPPTFQSCQLRLHSGRLAARSGHGCSRPRMLLGVAAGAGRWSMPAPGAARASSRTASRSSPSRSSSARTWCSPAPCSASAICSRPIAACRTC